MGRARLARDLRHAVHVAANRGAAAAHALEWLHGGACWALALLFAWELNWQVAERTAGVWASLAWGLVPALLLAWLGRASCDPRGRSRSTRLAIGCMVRHRLLSRFASGSS